MLDHLNRPIELAQPAKRIVSLCPSQTETIFALGQGHKLVGRTQFCIHPAQFVDAVAVVGGTKTAKVELIQALNPDLVIAEKEENTLATVEALSAFVPVYVTNVESVDDALKMIRDFGLLLEAEDKARLLIQAITRSFYAIPSLNQLRVAYLIWRNPYMAVGSNTYINDILGRMGLVNVFAGTESRYPKITTEQLLTAQPDVIMLSSEPYLFQEKHLDELKSLLQDNSVKVLVDGEMFSWYGSRMVEAGYYLGNLAQEWQVLRPASVKES
jgi:iron complex transport system substrate-binding protein